MKHKQTYFQELRPHFPGAENHRECHIRHLDNLKPFVIFKQFKLQHFQQFFIKYFFDFNFKYFHFQLHQHFFHHHIYMHWLHHSLVHNKLFYFYQFNQDTKPQHDVDEWLHDTSSSTSFSATSDHCGPGGPSQSSAPR